MALSRPTRLLAPLVLSMGVALSSYGCYRLSLRLIAHTAAGEAAAKLSEICVFTMDQVREDYLRDIKYAFQRGCYFGIDYPPEFKLPTSSFNRNSPVMYCNENYQTFEDSTVSSDLAKLGKQRR